MRKVIDDVNLSNDYCFEKLFNLSDVEVKGYFNCSKNYLTNLIGSPHTVGKNFDCSYNQLNSLEGAPKTVGGNFYCRNNRLLSLKGAPQYIGGHFDCRDNQLKNIEDIPKIIKGNFFLGQPLIEKFTLEYIYSLSNIRGNVTSLDQPGFTFY